MLIVKTYLKESPGKGIGLFANQDIDKNQIVHIEENFFDKEYSSEYVEKHNLFDFFRHYATFNMYKDSFYLCSDNGRFINHSSNPNLSNHNRYMIANRKILKDEEITCNYFEICDYDQHYGLTFNPIG